MNALEKWEENLKTLETINTELRIAVLMRSTAMPFKSEYVPVEKIDEFVKMGYVFATREPSVTMLNRDTHYPVSVPHELIKQYLDMGFTYANYDQPKR